MDLIDDCSRCVGLCCVALAFARSADFAIDKPAGSACPNLGQDHACSIHEDLDTRGFRGCAAYTCFGAGQRVHVLTFAGRGWRGDPDTARQMFAVFPVVRTLHELAWYVTEALDAGMPPSLDRSLRAALAQVERLAGGSPDQLLGLDLAQSRGRVNELLLSASAHLRDRPRPGPDLRGADLVGARMRGADLRRASLRGCLLMGADLREADLRGADLTGADLRDADLSGADLTGALFLTPAQVRAARGSRATKLPAALVRPSRWA
ncbi:MAG: pentapeptide repeat-containing protein [Candidatus Nanopelagicales bacterium]